MVVVLPAPLGPRIRITSPAKRSNQGPFNASLAVWFKLAAAVLNAQVFCPEDRVHRSPKNIRKGSMKSRRIWLTPSTSKKSPEHECSGLEMRAVGGLRHVVTVILQVGELTTVAPAV